MDDDDSIYIYRGAMVHDDTITKAVVEDGVELIYHWAFVDCKKLRVVSIANSVTKIDGAAFGNCVSLERIEIPDSVEYISWYAFTGCKSLETINLPRYVTKIGSSAFRDCSALQQVDIPEGIKVIEESTFEGCTSLRTITLPSTLCEIRRMAFRNCHSLENFIIPNGLPALLDFNPLDAGFEVFVWKAVNKIVANASKLQHMTLHDEDGEIVVDDDCIPEILELFSSCPSLTEVDLSWHYCEFTIKAFEKMASHGFPDHLRHLKFRFDKESGSETTYFLQVLDRNPKLQIFVEPFWDVTEDTKVRHHFEMNRYGCRGFNIPDSLWPELISQLSKLEERERRRRSERVATPRPEKESLDGFQTTAANILYDLLQRHLEMLVSHRERHACPWMRSYSHFGYEQSLGMAPCRIVATMHELQDRLKQHENEIKEKDDEAKRKNDEMREKDDEIKRLRRLLEQTNTPTDGQNELLAKRSRSE